MDKVIKTSIFPTQIDDRVFFQDMQIKDVPKFEEYQRHLKDGAYSKASAVLNSSDLTLFDAGTLNWFNGKLLNIEQEANRKDLLIKQYADDARQIAENLFLTYYQNDEPDIAELNQYDTWIR